MKAVSGKDLCKALERNGWHLKRIRGSHHIYVHPDQPDTIIPVRVHGKRTLRTGTQRGIMKDAGLSDVDL
jgi:predicted RNA binding protein YcfA (HicA-like mRNA interferase family)